MIVAEIKSLTHSLTHWLTRSPIELSWTAKNRGSSVKKNIFFCSRQKQIKQTGKYCCTVCKIIAHIGSRLPSAVQRCIFRLTCSHPELTEDHVLTSAYVKISRTVKRNAVNKRVWRKKDYSENQSAPKLENRKTSPCSPCAPNLLHVLVSRILGYHNLCSPGRGKFLWRRGKIDKLQRSTGW